MGRVFERRLQIAERGPGAPLREGPEHELHLEIGAGGRLKAPLVKVEHAYAQLGRWRRLSRYYEGSDGSARTWLEVASDGCARRQTVDALEGFGHALPMAGRSPIALMAVDGVEVRIVVDGFVDVLMADTPGVERYRASDFGDPDELIAEHGFAALVTVIVDGDRRSLLYDGGLTPTVLGRNLDVLGVRVADLRAIVISHGHTDHQGGLEGLARRLGGHRLPLIIHPGAWRERKIVFATGAELRLPPPSRADLEAEGLTVIEERGPTVRLDGTVLVSGQVERSTSFERGFPIHYARAESGWEPEPMIWDDQNVVVNVRGKGLVVLSGCSHAGAVNVLRNAQRLTGEDRIAGFVGGLHLTGGLFEPIIEETVAALAGMHVGIVMPAHCTGWRAVHALARAMPQAFVQPSIGTSVRF